jgi:integrase
VAPISSQGQSAVPQRRREPQCGCAGVGKGQLRTHTLRRTKATLIYRRTKNLRAVQLPLGHTKLESTVRYLGIEVNDALEMAEQTEV